MSMGLLDKLDRQEKKLSIAIADKLMVGFYDYSLADLRDMIAEAAAEIRRQGEVNRKLGDSIVEKDNIVRTRNRGRNGLHKMD